MWLEFILALLSPILKKLIERWLGGGVEMPFEANKAAFLDQADSGLFRASKRAVAPRLFDAAVKELEHVKVGSSVDVTAVVRQSKWRVTG